MNEGLGFAKFTPYPFDERLRGRSVPLYTARPRGGPAVVVCALAAPRLASPRAVAGVRALCRHVYGIDGTRAGIVGEGATGLLALAALADGSVAAAAGGGPFAPRERRSC